MMSFVGLERMNHLLMTERDDEEEERKVCRIVCADGTSEEDHT